MPWKTLQQQQNLILFPYPDGKYYIALFLFFGFYLHANVCLCFG